MQQVIEMGPLVLAADRLAAAVAIVAFLASTRLWRGLERPAAQNAATLAVVVGTVAARAAYVLQHLASFALEPWSALYVWQGGFDGRAGLAAAALALAISLARDAGARRVGSRPLLVPLACLAVTGGAGLAASAALERSADAPLPSGLVVATSDGRPLALDALRGRPFVVNLWATWCPPCRRELPMLVAAAAQRTDVPILLVNQGEDASTVLEYLADARLPTAPVQLDPAAEMSSKLGTRALPATLFVDAGGRVVRRHYGELSRAALADGLRLLSGAP